MYMRVVRARIDPSRLNEAGGQIGPDLAKAIRRQPGFQSLTGGTDRSSGQTILVSTWDTQEHASYSPAALGEIQSRLRALGVQADPPEIFEVTTPT